MRIVMTMRSQAGVPGRAGVPGGQIGMAQLARAHAQLGAEVTLFVGGPPMSYLDDLDGVHVRHLRWPLRLDRAIDHAPHRLRDLGRRLRRRRWLAALTALPELDRADVVHVQGLEDAQALLTRLDGPLVVTHWGRAGRWSPTAGNGSRSRTTAGGGITLVAIGDTQARALAEVGYPAAAVIPPGVDLARFTPGDRSQARQNLGLATDAPVVLYVGRLAADKNVATLLEAFARLDQHPHARLLVIGDGPAKGGLVRAATGLGISRAVTFIPFIAHHLLPSYYRAADVTVVPSDRPETFCLVALEAIACGCPVIVTDQVPEIVQSFPDVARVGPHDIDALRAHLHRALRGELTAADTTPVASYDWTTIGRRYAEVYQTALRRRSH